jgi:hypothetical protein
MLDFTAWSATHDLLHYQLRKLGRFSALRAVYSAHPKFIAEKMRPHIDREKALSDEKKRPHILKLRGAGYVVQSILFSIMGVCAFAWKFIEISYAYNTSAEGRYMLWIRIAGFMNQAMGMVDVNDELRRRLFLFMFGGDDVVMQEQEKEREIAYSARIMEVIYEVYGGRGTGTALAVMMTFDHKDLQRLVISRDEDE